jgi:AcrR family transcriptional regulator
MSFSALPEEEQEARPERLVQAARELATESGSAAFTVAQVTMRAGLSLKSFYRCYPGKDDLLLALLAADSAIGAEVLEERMAGRTGAAGVEAYFTELFEMLTWPGASGYAGILVREYLRLSEHHDDELRQSLAPLLDLLARNIESAQPKRDAHVMFGVLLGGIHDVVTGKVTDAGELARYLHRFCTQGVGG